MTDEELIREARWAVEWLTGLIEDERVDDLADDDEYVIRALALRDALNARHR